MKPNNLPEVSHSQSGTTSSEFRGYSMDELKYKRAVMLVKREILKEKALKEVSNIKKRIPGINGESPMASMSKRGIMGKVFKGLNYMDYIVLGFSVFNVGRKFFSIFRKTKR